MTACSYLVARSNVTDESRLLPALAVLRLGDFVPLCLGNEIGELPHRLRSTVDGGQSFPALYDRMPILVKVLVLEPLHLIYCGVEFEPSRGI